MSNQDPRPPHKANHSRLAARPQILWGVALLALLLLGGCGRGDDPTPTVNVPTESADNNTVPAAVLPNPTETANEESTPPPLEANEGGTIPPPAATRGPLEETIERLFLDSLPFPLSPQDAGIGINAIALLPVSVGEETPSTWLVHTVGLRDFATDQVHRINMYQQAGTHVVAEVARLNLSDETLGAEGQGIPDYLAENAVAQVAIEPSSLWFTVEAGAGAHAGVFDLLRFDPATNAFSVALAANSPSPGVAHVEDVNDDGLGEVVVNTSDPYVFCYACGIVLPGVELYRWDGEAMVRVELTTLGAESGEAQEINQRLLDLANAGLWRDVDELLPQAQAMAALDSPMEWNLSLLRMNAEARRTASANPDSPFPLLPYLFYGDFDHAGEVLRAHTPADLFATPSALISDTVAAGWEETLANWIERSTAPALEHDPDLVEGWLARGYGAWLIGDIAESSAWLERAHSLQPDDAFLAESLSRVAQPQSEETAHLAALSPVEVRSGPGNSFPILLTLQPGDVMTITGRFGAAADLWWQVPGRDANMPGWVRADDARVSALLTEHVPEVVAPAQVAPVAQQGRILYSAEGSNGVASLYEIAVAPLSTPLLIIDEARQPAIRAQGDVIAFASDRADMLGIGGISLQTGERLRYTFNSEDSLPRWNGLGDQILFSSTREGDRRERIYRVFAEGAVNSQTLRFGNDADWNQLNGEIVFKGCDTSGNSCGLWTMKADGSGAATLTDNPGDSRPRWSPDGSHVLFMSDQRDGNWELYEVTVADGAITRLTTSPGEDGLPIYNASGDAIAWVRHDESGWSLVTQQLAGGADTLLLDFGASFPNWLDQGLDWTP